MFYFKLVQFLLPLTFLVGSSSFSQASSQIHDQPSLHIGGKRTKGIIEGGTYNVVSWGKSRRSVLDQKHSVELGENNSMILAEKRTHRKDPLNDFRYYKGGWNITDEHYFASVAYTAAPLFIIATIWFLLYAVILFIICIRHCCCKLNNYGYSRTIYAVSLILLIFFTVAVIIGSAVLYTGEEKFHISTTGTLKYVVNQADSTAENLTILSEYLSAAKGVGVDQIYLPVTDLNDIDKIKYMINDSAIILRRETEKNSDTIQTVLRAIRVTLIAVAAVMLFLALLGFLLSIFGLQFFVHLLAIIGWMLATIALLLCCAFLVLHNIVGDTCVAMDEWVQNPTALTAMDHILPCLDNATAQATLAQSKLTTSKIVGVVNFFIANVSNINIPPNFPPNLPPDVRKMYYNQSGPLVPVLCNPFNSDMTDRICAAGEVDLSTAPQEWTKYVCQVSADGNCTTTGRLTPNFYDEMVASVRVAYALYRYGPFLVGLVDCSFVRETFIGITKDHCPSLDRYSNWVFIGLNMVSFAVMLSLIFWFFYARERRHRVRTKQVESG